jgi:hypothetical protein
MALEQKQSLGQFLVTVAGSDGHIRPEELKVLGKIYGLLGMERSLLYRHCHALEAGGAPPATEPVTVRVAGTDSSGLSIPTRTPASLGFSLDMKRVEAKIGETAVVASMLSRIFTDDETPQLKHQDPRLAASGLDAAHLGFLRDLTARATWSRSEVEALANKHSLLLDGAIDRVNELSLERCDEPACDGDDVVHVNTAVIQELLA